MILLSSGRLRVGGLVAAMVAVAACGGRVAGDDAEDGGRNGTGGATSGGATGAGDAGAGDAGEGGAIGVGTMTGGVGIGGFTPGGSTPGGGSTPAGGTVPAGGAQPDTGGTQPAGGTPHTGGTQPDTGGSPSGGGGAGGEAPLTEADLVRCGEDSECIVVPYDHCCGATRRGINEAYLDEYEARPEWQSFSDPEACAAMDECLDDSMVTSASCVGAPDGNCQLVFPVQCADLDCDFVCPAGEWLDPLGCPTCSCAAPPLGMTVSGGERPVESVTLTVTGSSYVGGYNRTELELRWRYDDADTDDEEDEVIVTVMLLSPPVGLPLEMATYGFEPLSDALAPPLVDYVALFPGEQIELTATGGFLSIRTRADGQLEGGILLTTADGTEVSGPFVLPDPWGSS